MSVRRPVGDGNRAPPLHGHLHDLRATARDRRLPAECGWPRRKDRHPLTLLVGERTGVVDVDPGMHAPDLLASSHPGDVTLPGARSDQLRPAQHPALRSQELGESRVPEIDPGGHPATVPRPVPSGHELPRCLWRRARVARGAAAAGGSRRSLGDLLRRWGLSRRAR
ncbi:hypothetical protein GCM10025786_23290 [Nocardioides caeni]